MFTKQDKTLADIYTAMLESKNKKAEADTEVEVGNESEVSDKGASSADAADDPAADNTPSKKKKEDEKDVAEKMDPVGKADADIDNDGDVDDSDEYLHNRRKAIKKAMKESFADRADAREEALRTKIMEHVGSRSISEEELEMIARRLGMRVADVKTLLKYPTEDMAESVEVELNEAYTKAQIMKLRKMLGREGMLDKGEGLDIIMRKVGVDKTTALAMWRAAKGSTEDQGDYSKRLNKKVYGKMMGGLKEELDESVELDAEFVEAFTIAATKAGAEYQSRKAKERQDQHKKQDPKHAKTHARNMVDMDKAAKKAEKKGVSMRDYGKDNWKVRNGVQRGKLPEGVEENAEVVTEAKDHPAYDALMKLAKKMNNRDTRLVQTVAGKLSNFTATGNRGMFADIAKAFRSADDDTQEQMMAILMEKDPAMAKSIMGKM